MPPGTTTTRGSPVSRAIGVTWLRSTGDLLVMIAPTMTIPPMISASGLPLLELTNWARPMVPPAPPLLSTRHLGHDAAARERNLQRASSLIPPAAGSGRHQYLQAVERKRRRREQDADRTRQSHEQAAGYRERGTTDGHGILLTEC